MRCINNIATPKIFKLYDDPLYLLYPYSSNDSIPELSKKYRLNNKLIFKDLSNLTGYSESYVCNVEKGTVKSSKDYMQHISNPIRINVRGVSS